MPLGGMALAITQFNADTAFSMNIVLPDALAGHVVSLTATSPQGSTSEISACFDLANVTVVSDQIFGDGFEDLTGD